MAGQGGKARRQGGTGTARAKRDPAKPSAALVAALRRVGQVTAAGLDQAQDRAFDAMEAAAAGRRIALAAAALEVTPLSADAWGVLAAAAPEDGGPLQLALWRQAVAAGTLAIGPLGFLEMEGEFWGWHETRPYMRARHGLAEALWRAGARGEAIAGLQDMLRLNPNDNQGVRYRLLGWLLAGGDRDAEAAALVERYREDGYAGWLYGAALLAFRREGAGGAGAEAALAEALKENPHLAPLLTGARAMPAELPDVYAPGEESEAQVAFLDMQPAWAATPGAIAWLAERVPPGEGEVAAKPVRPRRRPRGTGDG